MKIQLIVSVAAVLSLAACGGASYTATLSGSNEVPAVTTSASGTFTGTMDGTSMDVTGSYTGLSGPATAAHIHGPSDASNTGPVVCTLTATESATAGTGTLSGECTGTSALTVTDLNNGMYYVNVHTTAHGGGEIRGQISKPK
jgi:CHRD domain-containing protein